MGIFNLTSEYGPSGDQPEAIEQLKAGLDRGEQYQTLLGITGSGKTFTVANVIRHFNKPVLVIAPNKALAAQLYREYKNYFPEHSVNYFVSYYDYYQPEAYMPGTDTYIEKEAMINQEIDRLRHQATSALLTRKDVIVVASVSCIYGLGVPMNYFASAIHLAVGQQITRGDLISQLIKIQFTRTAGVLKRGEFRVRGDVFEIMPASETMSYAIELGPDQTVTDIAIIDPVTRTMIDHPQDVALFPPKHFISSAPEIARAVKDIKTELDDRLAYFNEHKLYLEAQRLERRVRYDMEMLKSLGFCHGVENYSRHLSGKLVGEAPDTLLDYFPRDKQGKPDFLLVMDESHIGVPQVRGMYAGDRSRKDTLVKYGWRLPSAMDNRPLMFKEFEQRIGQTIFVSATPGDWELEHSKTVVEQVIRPTGLIDPPITVRPVFDKDKNRSQIIDVMEELHGVVKKGERALVITLTKKQAEDLNDHLTNEGFKSRYIHSEVKTFERTEILMDFRRGIFDVLIGVNLLREGLDLPEVTLVAILDADREGFLRSETSLIQTMGRAARNVSGTVILYADKVTGSMQRAMDIVDKRRKLQMAYNKKHGITPKTIHKAIEYMLDFSGSAGE
ncbi:excinuclease ABC subunit B [Candidatus Wolfebacteria bacterium RIFOXYD12_FULL_48_21]|uniref:Excinuclease ABC subunit B n=1 Tax=Candidatus Wolfebacteria bacterium RIFOXYD1_FULL_48_65 TaxID=1802561 RepID=A0A1F8DZN2_9BACT|nr:MAG: excinuclease ABC subunit B [Candidatus Wolfebacteria bacterium RIFOXYD1_FULL_48_65]OGM94546.1 MAG: excinuclease ABC subunit B [Candidatus Wolfebacteria bacterium RIFOXYD12_FULL_48_21]